ncbi:uncharacterized protein PV09_02102 [Verruconis gallopava]|uniref:Glycosyltransferase family 69 protein n=1 Tax=Verruconis gallopava TaxID=253628 RepID=A0A0D1XWR9_9PEZI|nr:uncharacterized protein PV09_02102 [Verruconis gallopava]KIW07246.1 hypothetical protein PV09_02102 [Verruconis gallopava]
MTLFAARRQPQHHGYRHVPSTQPQHHPHYDDPSSTESDDDRSVELLEVPDVELACKAYASHHRSRSNSSLSSLSSIISSFAPGTHGYIRAASPRSRVRLARRVVHVALLALALWIFVTPIINPSYTHRPYHYSGMNLRREKVFIAANIIDEELIRGPWGESVEALVELLGEDNVFLSIYENDSGPGTKAALRDLAAKVKCRTSIVSDHIDIDAFPKVQVLPNEQRVKRIAYLAHVRNKAIEPLTRNATGMLFDKLLFLNDVIFSPKDAADLLFSTNIGPDGATRYHAACAMDFINPFKYYDTFATRDAEGHGLGVPFFPFFTSAGHGFSRADMLAGTDAVRVKSCWGGMVAFEAKWFVDQRSGLLLEAPDKLGSQSSTKPDGDERTRKTTTANVPSQQPTRPKQVRFRSLPELMWDASECCLIHADIGELAAKNPEPWENPQALDHGIYMNPFIRVAYDSRTHSWLEFTRRFERLYPIAQSFVNWLVSRPPYQARRAEVPGTVVWRRGWVFDGPVRDDVNRSRLHSHAITDEVAKFGHWEDIRQIASPGGFCGGRQLLLLKPQPWMPGERIWYKITPPKGAED